MQTEHYPWPQGGISSYAPTARGELPKRAMSITTFSEP
jgi:hypothetical protein